MVAESYSAAAALLPDGRPRDARKAMQPCQEERGHMVEGILRCAARAIAPSIRC